MINTKVMTRINVPMFAGRDCVEGILPKNMNDVSMPVYVDFFNTMEANEAFIVELAFQLKMGLNENIDIVTLAGDEHGKMLLAEMARINAKNKLSSLTHTEITRKEHDLVMQSFENEGMTSKETTSSSWLK